MKIMGDSSNITREYKMLRVNNEPHSADSGNDMGTASLLALLLGAVGLAGQHRVIAICSVVTGGGLRGS